MVLGTFPLGAEENKLTLASAIEQLSDADYHKRETAKRGGQTSS